MPTAQTVEIAPWLILNMADVLAPLYRLLRKEACWRWTDTEKVFQASKDLLTSSTLLVHFNLSVDSCGVSAECDASTYNVGAVLANRSPDGSELPIGYLSCSLSAAQCNYSQLERETLALVFGV